MRLTNLQSANALPNTRGFSGKRLKMSNESSYIFMLRAGGSELEVTHNEQSGDVHISEAQILLKGDHVEGGCLFFIDEVYDMDKLISFLSEIREKMVKHYAAKGDRSLAEAIASGPYCTQCGNPQTKEEIGARISLCFDCEKKQIIQAADSFKPVVCMVCEGQFDNLLQKQIGVCGKCMISQAKKDKRNVGSYVEGLKSTLTPEQKELINGVPKQVVHVPIIPDKIIMCKHIECDNEAAPGQTKCYLHIKQPKTYLAEGERELTKDEISANEYDACVAHGICTHTRCGNSSEKGSNKCFLHISKDVDGFQNFSKSEIDSINTAWKDTDEKPLDLNLPKPKLRTITPTDITKPGC